jgi:hypothetical protein
VADPAAEIDALFEAAHAVVFNERVEQLADGRFLTTL